MADNIPRFGANDFYLTETDPLALREALRAALAEVLGRPVLDSDPHMVLASAFLPFMVQGQASADAASKATLRAFAVGQDLDRIADSTCVVGYMDRLPARGAVLACIIDVTIARPSYASAATVTVTWSASRGAVVDGQAVTFSGSGNFEIAFAAAQESQALHIPAYLVADVTGPQCNGFFATESPYPVVDSDISADVSASDDSGNQCQCEDVSVSRCGSTYNGADVESDADFAERVAWQAKALRVPGSLEYFKLILSNLRLLASSHVAQSVDSDGRIVMAWCDKVAYYAGYASETLAARGAAYDAFRVAVQDSLLVEQRVMAYPARERSVMYTAQYKVPALTTDIYSARTAIERAWRLYVADHAWHCGAIISTAEMCAVLTGAGASDVQIVTQSAPYIALPADTMQTDRYFAISYRGKSTDSAAPAGSDGEEITP